jgi:hypothetical protein
MLELLLITSSKLELAGRQMSSAPSWQLVDSSVIRAANINQPRIRGIEQSAFARFVDQGWEQVHNNGDRINNWDTVPLFALYH